MYCAYVVLKDSNLVESEIVYHSLHFFKKDNEERRKRAKKSAMDTLALLNQHNPRGGYKVVLMKGIVL